MQKLSTMSVIIHFKTIMSVLTVANQVQMYIKTIDLHFRCERDLTGINDFCANISCGYFCQKKWIICTIQSLMSTVEKLRTQLTVTTLLTQFCYTVREDCKNKFVTLYLRRVPKEIIFYSIIPNSNALLVSSVISH